MDIELFNSNSKSKDENKNNIENAENFDKLNLDMNGRKLIYFYPPQLKIVPVKEKNVFVDKELSFYSFYHKILFRNSEK